MHRKSGHFASKLKPVQNDDDVMLYPLVDSDRCAKVARKDLALVSRYRWHLKDGCAWARLHDLYGLEVELNFLLHNPNLAKNSPSMN